MCLQESCLILSPMWEGVEKRQRLACEDFKSVSSVEKVVVVLRFLEFYQIHLALAIQQKAMRITVSLSLGV